MEGQINNQIKQKQQKQNEKQNKINFLETSQLIGKYQIKTLIIWALLGLINGGMEQIVPILFYQSAYNCPLLSQSQNCETYLCQLPLPQRSKYFPQNDISSVLNTFGDFRCGQNIYRISTYLSIIYSSQIVSFLLLTIFGGILSKKKILLICLFFCVLGYSLAISAASIETVVVGIFISLLGSTAAFSTAFLFITQTIPQKYRFKTSVITMFFYGFGFLTYTGLYYIISNWIYLLAFTFVIPAFILFFLVLFIVYDTPYDLILANQQIALTSLRQIALQNGNEVTLSIQDIKQASLKTQRQEQSRFTFLDLFKYKSLRWMTLLASFVFSTIMFQFYIPILMMASFNLNIFLNGAILATSVIIAYPFAYCAVSFLKRHVIAYFCFSIIAVCSFVLIFIWSANKQEHSPIKIAIIIIVLFILRVVSAIQFIVFFVYLTQIYPTQVRSIGFGFVSVIAYLVVTSNPIIISTLNQKDINIMIPFCISAVLSIIASIFIPQTHQVLPQDVIQQLRQSDLKICKNPQQLPSPINSAQTGQQAPTSQRKMFEIKN